MALAVSDMDICRKITPQFLASRLSVLNHAQLIVADANLPAESLRFLAENCTPPLFVDPVSTGKAEKLRPVLGRIHTLKPNRMEAELLSGVEIRDEAGLAEAAGRCWTRACAGCLFPWEKTASLRRTTGRACFCLVDRRRRSMPPERETPSWPVWPGPIWRGRICRAPLWPALAPGAIAIEGAETINPALSAGTLRARMLQ